MTSKDAHQQLQSICARAELFLQQHGDVKRAEMEEEEEANYANALNISADYLEGVDARAEVMEHVEAALRESRTGKVKDASNEEHTQSVALGKKRAIRLLSQVLLQRWGVPANNTAGS